MSKTVGGLSHRESWNAHRRPVEVIKAELRWMLTEQLADANKRLKASPTERT